MTNTHRHILKKRQYLSRKENTFCDLRKQGKLILSDNYCIKYLGAQSPVPVLAAGEANDRAPPILTSQSTNCYNYYVGRSVSFTRRSDAFPHASAVLRGIMAVINPLSLLRLFTAHKYSFRLPICPRYRSDNIQ